MPDSLQPTKYAQHRYNITQPVDFEVAVKYGAALMAIAGADGELAEAEFQWYIDEQELLMKNPEEYIETLRKFDWKNASLEELLSGIKYDFPLNFRRSMLYQAIKMSRADGAYHDQEKAAVAKAAEILGIERSVKVSLESMAELEEASERLRLALFETEV
ncbi:TerB family tellurite resistance protein [Roseofilum capinflatum]|uniref:TerB family tellurite resistance protein n=1 Tax=Roseofilum capinflatum BLCC-M114 TaxID=3022440 RepID=A0ABT7B2J2_9CYAN|nr:TerB family tellurite resistance protein [Roseofilum capinflatum]MDJ1172538.1 TerB family tellurite resistance protein [Roseofilum capinflatum BLCC-M114]